MGDVLMVGPGEVVPVDGHLVGPAVLDESALTGEPLPVEREPGSQVCSGTVNAGSPLSLVASTVRRRLHVRPPRAPGGAGAGLVSAVRPDGRPVRNGVRAAHAGAGRAAVVAQRRSRAGGRRPGGRHPVPAPAGRADRLHVRAVASGPGRRGGQGRRGAGTARERTGPAVRQDRDADRGPPAGRRRRHRVPRYRRDPAVPRPEGRRRSSGGRGPTRCCGWPRRWTRFPRTCSPTRSSPSGVPAGCRWSCPTPWSSVPGTASKGRVGGHLVRLGKAAWILGDAPAPWAARVQRRAALDGSLTVFVAVDGHAGGRASCWRTRCAATPPG